MANRYRVKHVDPTATLSLALTDKPDADGCYEIHLADLEAAQSHGFMLYRVPAPPEPVSEEAEGDEGDEDAGEDSGEGEDNQTPRPRRRLKRK